MGSGRRSRDPVGGYPTQGRSVSALYLYERPGATTVQRMARTDGAGRFSRRADTFAAETGLTAMREASRRYQSISRPTRNVHALGSRIQVSAPRLLGLPVGDYPARPPADCVPRRSEAADPSGLCRLGVHRVLRTEGCSGCCANFRARGAGLDRRGRRGRWSLRSRTRVFRVSQAQLNHQRPRAAVAVRRRLDALGDGRRGSVAWGARRSCAPSSARSSPAARWCTPRPGLCTKCSGPAVAEYGRPDLVEDIFPLLLRGEEFWCQEGGSPSPEAGSDLGIDADDCAPPTATAG